MNLDLSACTRSTATAGGGLLSNGTFAPAPGSNSTGEPRIVNLILPTLATNIQGGSTGSPSFRFFTSLRTISGSNVTEVRSNTFNNLSNLTTVSIPGLTWGIRHLAFESTGVKTIYLGTIPTDLGSLGQTPRIFSRVAQTEHTVTFYVEDITAYRTHIVSFGGGATWVQMMGRRSDFSSDTIPTQEQWSNVWDNFASTRDNLTVRMVCLASGAVYPAQ